MALEDSCKRSRGFPVICIRMLSTIFFLVGFYAMLDSLKFLLFSVFFCAWPCWFGWWWRKFNELERKFGITLVTLISYKVSIFVSFLIQFVKNQAEAFIFSSRSMSFPLSL